MSSEGLHLNSVVFAVDESLGRYEDPLSQTRDCEYGFFCDPVTGKCLQVPERFLIQKTQPESTPPEEAEPPAHDCSVLRGRHAVLYRYLIQLIHSLSLGLKFLALLLSRLRLALTGVNSDPPDVAPPMQLGAW